MQDDARLPHVALGDLQRERQEFAIARFPRLRSMLTLIDAPTSFVSLYRKMLAAEKPPPLNIPSASFDDYIFSVEFTGADGWSCTWSAAATKVGGLYDCLINPQPWTNSARPAWLSEFDRVRDDESADAAFDVNASFDERRLSIFVTRRCDMSSICLINGLTVEECDEGDVRFAAEDAPMREPLFEQEYGPYNYPARAVLEPSIELETGDVRIGFCYSGYDFVELLDEKKALEYLEDHAPWPKAA